MGTGLGLAVCKSTVELMRGTVGVTSVLGEGAVFWMEIPIIPCLREPTGGDTLQLQESKKQATSASTALENPSFLQAAGVAVTPTISITSTEAVSRNIFSWPASKSADVATEPSAHTLNELSRRSMMRIETTNASACAIGDEQNVDCTVTPRSASRWPDNPHNLHTRGPVFAIANAAPDRTPVAFAFNSSISSRAALNMRTVTRVVVVDDVRSNRELFARMLRRFGAVVVYTAEHGADALEQIKMLQQHACDTSAVPARPVMSVLPDIDRRRIAAPEGVVIEDASVASEFMTLPNTALSMERSTLLPKPDDLIDVWFVDGNMPIMDGLELTRRLRCAGVCAPIIAVTGNTLAEDVAAFVQAGASTVLSKPSTAVKVHEALARVGVCLPLFA
jgi:CheY-like chemotaxis protein